METFLSQENNTKTVRDNPLWEANRTQCICSPLGPFPTPQLSLTPKLIVEKPPIQISAKRMRIDENCQWVPCMHAMPYAMNSLLATSKSTNWRPEVEHNMCVRAR